MARKLTMADLEVRRDKPRKYHNQRIEIDGMWFDSKAEGRRWGELKLMEHAGEISELQRQVAIPLCPPVRMGAAQRLKPAIRLIVDFRYRDKTGKVVLEDTKSPATLTDVFRLKLHLLKDLTGQEVRITS